MSRIFFISLTLFLLISGCKSDPDTSTKNNPWNRTSNEVIIRIDDEPDRLNPLLYSTAYADQVLSQIFLRLLDLDPVKLTLIPSLATARPTIENVTEGPNKGGVSYTFEIHPEAVWDDGLPVTGEDFAFGVKAAMIPTLKTERIRPYLSIINAIEIDPSNPKKFTVFVKEKSFMAEEVIGGTIPVIPAHLYDEMGYLVKYPVSDFLDKDKIKDLAENNDDIKAFVRSFNSVKFSRSPDYIRGCGPYKLKEWKTGESVVLDKKENWWGDKLMEKYPAISAYPDRLIFKDIIEDAIISSLIKSEEIDVVADVKANDFLALRKDPTVNKKYNFFTPSSTSLYFIYLNTKDPMLSDKRVRKAFAHAINVDEIIETIMGGFATRVSGPVSPLFSFYNHDLKLIDYNIDAAKKLLAEAGWSDSNNDGTVDKVMNGERVELVIPMQIVAGSSRQKNMVLLAIENAKPAGIGIKAVDLLDFNKMKENTRTGNYTAAVAGRRLSPISWNPKQSWSTENDNRTGFGNAETDALIDEIMTTLDEAKRNELYKKLQAIIYDEQPEIPLFTPTSRIVIHKRFETDLTVQHPGFIPNRFRLKK